MGMRPTTKKPQSRRIAASKRYKVEKKVREHHRKVRREARLNPKKSKKDPGVPNLHPLKDQLLRTAELAKERAQEEKLARAKEHREFQMLSKRGLSLEDLQADAQQRSDVFDSAAELAAMDNDDDAGVRPAGAGARDLETSRRTFYKEFKKVLEAADVVLEVLDCRDPLGSRSSAIEQAVIEAGSRKKLVLVLNKIDLVPREVVEKWLKHLRNEYPTVAFKASTQTQKKHLATKADSLDASGGSESRGADALLKLLGNYCRNMNIKTAIRVGVVGYPNVGKSSIINSLKRSRACGVGATPGFTKTTQEISLDKHIKLIDSPGIVLSNSSSGDDLILRNVVKLEQLEDPVGPVESILKRCNPAQIMEYYAIPAFQTTLQFLQHVARQRGKMKRGGVPDCHAAARVVLQDWNGGKISFYTVPPESQKMPTHISSTVVTQWGKEFDIDSLLDADSAVLDESKMDSDDMIVMSASEPRHEVFEDTDMDTEVEKEAQFVTTVLPKSTKSLSSSKKRSSQPADVLDSEEAALNPQTNQDRRKRQKAEKKARRKAEAAEVEQDVAMDDDAPYDFAADFVGADDGLDQGEDWEDDMGDDDDEDDDDEDGL